MSWLYDRREQLDGLRPFVEIAHRLIYPIPYHDRDDVEQEIVINLKRVVDRHGEVEDNYLWGAARNVIRHYWRKRYRQARRFRHLVQHLSKLHFDAPVGMISEWVFANKQHVS